MTDLENQLRSDQEEHRAAISICVSEMNRLRGALEKRINQVKDLLDINIALGEELAECRELTVSEQPR